MLAVAEAQARVYAAFGPLPAEWVALDDGLGRVLAGDLAARHGQPPAAVSAMDGYAVRAADTEPAGRPLLVVGEVPAGGSHPRPLLQGEAVRVFTGGPLPDGADAVVIQENASVDGDAVRFTDSVAPGTFVRPAGLDFARGWVGLRAGSALDARALGLAAAMGHVWLPVRRRPRVGVLSTGDELRRPGEPAAGPSQIVSSNNTTLCAAVRAWGCVPVDLGIVPDRPEALAEALADAAGLDLLLTSGGASVGDYDVVGQALGGGASGAELSFWKIAMRPGKPLLFGRTGPGVRVLGLPGNPVSASVCALVFARGAIRRMLGLEPELPRMAAVLARGLAANDRREDYVRARHVGRHPGGRRLVEVAERQDSSMFATFAAADALVVRPPHDPPRSEGDEVEVVDLRQAFLPFA